MAAAGDAVAPAAARSRVDVPGAVPISLRIGLVILLAHALVAVVGWIWTPYGYAKLGTGIPLSGMSWQHPFGVDQLGRDVFSRVSMAAMSTSCCHCRGRSSGWWWARSSGCCRATCAGFSTRCCSA